MSRPLPIPFFSTLLLASLVGCATMNSAEPPMDDAISASSTGGDGVALSDPTGLRSEDRKTASVDESAPLRDAEGGEKEEDMVTESVAMEPSIAKPRPMPHPSVVRTKSAEKKDYARPHPIAPASPAGEEMYYDFGAVSGGVAVTSSPPPPPVTQIPAHLNDNSEHYTDYGINGFVLTSQDPLSTFAADVDTASYAISRRKLNEGYLPAQSAVRVEEFVNYFPYEYTQPKKGEPFAVDIEASPSPWNARNHIVRVGVQGKKIAFDQRKPVHLTFLVDTSGSMQSRDKIGMLKDTLIMLTEELEDGDTVAIATYAGSTSIVLEPTPMSQKKKITTALARLEAGGSTAMSSGIDLAYQLADATYVNGDVNRVIVCSDGDANVGRTSHTDISKQIRGYADKGITLTTVGFGNGNYKDTMMERLANDGDGNYFYIDSMDESRRVFSDKLTGTLEVIAKDVKLQVEWDPSAVYAYRLIGYENRDVADKDFRNDKVDAGEIGAGHQVTALYEVALADGATGALGTVRVRNKAPGPDSPAVERTYTVARDSLHADFAETSDQFRLAVAAGGFSEILRGSPHMEEITLRQVQAVAKGAARAEYKEDAELVELIGRAAQLKGEATFSMR